MKKQIDGVIDYKTAAFVDFHTHILPQADDGSHSAEQSLDMLRTLREQGVRTVVATPHFYVNMECPEDFLYGRDNATERLVKAARDCGMELPHVCLGAEVPYFSGIGGSRALSSLCIVGTHTILIEMPSKKWSDAVIDEIIRIKRVDGFGVVIAHIERYAEYQSRKVLDRLSSEGIVFQLNCEAFYRFVFKRFAFRMLRGENKILLGTDCHDMDLRKPDMSRAIEAITGKAGFETVEGIMRTGEALLRDAKFIL